MMRLDRALLDTPTGYLQGSRSFDHHVRNDPNRRPAVGRDRLYQ